MAHGQSRPAGFGPGAWGVEMTTKETKPMTKTITPDYWIACMGLVSVEDVFAEADRQSITPQDYVESCVREAEEQLSAADYDSEDKSEWVHAARRACCAELGIPES